MPNHSIKTDLQDFVQFATHRIERGDSSESVEALVQQWRTDVEFSQTVADIRQGLADKAAGLAEPGER